MTKTILERGQAVANSLYDLEVVCEAEQVTQPVTDAVAALHDKLNKLRAAFGVDLVEPENLRSGVIAFSGGTNKDNPPPPGGG